MRFAFLSRITRLFNGETLYHEPLGGTQSAMIYLARALVERGHEAHIFCNPSQAGCFDGVHYHPIVELARFSRQNPLDVFVSVAGEQTLKLGIPARVTLWWSHNDYSYLWDEMPDLRADIANTLATKADRIVTVSQWQTHKLAELFQLPIEHFWTSRNGVYWPHFEQSAPPAIPPRIMYTSVPDRGLKRLLDLFPSIQAQVPEAELHVYSSFKVWGKSEQWDHAHAGDIYQRAEQMPGVFLFAPVPQSELAQALKQATLMAYPNHEALETGFWAETSCIAALEAQAAGLPVVTSARGALPETILDCQTGLLIAGDPHSEAYGNEFVAACVKLLKDRVYRDQLSQKARQRMESEFRWEDIAQSWEAEFGPEFVSTRQAQGPLKSPFVSPKISIIIPTYNRARNLKHCLESLTWQDETAFEVIICDDGSSDNTREVAEAYKDRLNLRYRYQQDLGFRAAEARNMGIKIARGKILIFLDSDLVVPASFVRAHAQAHARYGKAKVVVNSFVWRMLECIDEDLGLPPAEYIAKHQGILKPDSRTRYQLFERSEPVEETYFLDSNALSIKREDLELFGGFDGEFVGWGHEDTELGYRIAQYGFKLLMIREGAEAYHIYHYVSDSKDDERAENWKRLAQKHGISKWYHPLGQLESYGEVIIEDLQTQSIKIEQAHWELKVGHPAPVSGHYYRLIVDKGVLNKIEILN